MRVRTISSWVLICLAGICSFCASILGLFALFFGGTPHFFGQFAILYLGFLTVAIVFPTFLISFVLFFRSPRASPWPLWCVFLLSCVFNVAQTLSYCSPMH